MPYPLHLHDLLSSESITPTNDLGVYTGTMNSQRIIVFQFTNFDQKFQQKIISTLECECILQKSSFEQLIKRTLICDQNNNLKCRRLRKLEQEALNMLRKRNDTTTSPIETLTTLEASPTTPSLVFLKKLAASGSSLKSLDPKIKRLDGLPLPIQTSQRPLSEVRKTLIQKCPDYVEVVDRILAKAFRLEPLDRLHIEPLLLVGPPGSGKSTFLKELVRQLGFQTTSLNLGGMQDDHFLAGVSSGYASAQSSELLNCVVKQSIANPILIFDELDKTPPTQNVNIHSRLLGLLEPHESKNWYESFLQSHIDCSNFSFLFTANTTDGIPKSLLSRLTVIKMPTLSDAHLRTYIQQMLKEICATSEIDPRFYPLSVCDYELLAHHWPNHRNLRHLRKQLSLILATNDASHEAEVIH